jgi:5'-3' exonuclease
MGVTTWAMVEYEADDALGSAAAVAAADDRVDRVIICTPDKDLGQCVGGKVVQLDRRKNELFDAKGVEAKFGVPPASIPDYLALVGDSADGFPGLAGWGAKSAAAVLARYGHLEDIPSSAGQWDVPGLRGAPKLSATLQAQMGEALLFRRIATVECDVPVGRVDEWRWDGPRADFTDWANRLGNPGLAGRASRLAGR